MMTLSVLDLPATITATALCITAITGLATVVFSYLNNRKISQVAKVTDGLMEEKTKADVAKGVIQGTKEERANPMVPADPVGIPAIQSNTKAVIEATKAINDVIPKKEEPHA